MIDILEFGQSFFTKLIFILNPLIVAPFFLAIAGSYRKEEQRRMALKSCLFAGGLLFITALFGNHLLGSLISAQDLKIAGGILLFYSGFGMVMGSTRNPDEGSQASTDTDIALVPLGFPLIAGPASMITIITSLAEVPQARSFIEGAPYYGATFVVIALVIGILCVSFLVGPSVIRILGRGGMTIVQRLAGLVLTAMAAQMVVKGVKDSLVVPEVVAPAPSVAPLEIQ